MARARNIKPGFFKNEDLAECSPWSRLCFAGLWTLADREGRLEDRAKRIKGELFAFDSIEVEPLLQELARHKFIVRYEVDGQRFIQVSKFLEHQTPHYTEKQSSIKPPDFLESPPQSTAQDSKKTPGAGQQSRGGQNPLNPDSLIPEKNTSLLSQAPALPPEDRPEPPDGFTLSAVPNTKPGPSLPDCPHQAVLSLWAEALPAMPQHLPSQWRGSRADHLRARWRETAAEKGWQTEAEGLAYLRKLFAYVGQSPFLTGRAASRDPNKRPFVIELEWLVNPTNWAKVHEGKYHQAAA